jgi:hypothetical protein
MKMFAHRVRLWLSSVVRWNPADAPDQPDPGRRMLLTGAAALLACGMVGVGFPSEAEAGSRKRRRKHRRRRRRHGRRHHHHRRRHRRRRHHHHYHRHYDDPDGCIILSPLGYFCF